MIIALEYDGTYTRDPALWDAFIGLARQRGHEVSCVTMRHPEEAIQMPCEVIYTARASKLRHLLLSGRTPPHVWIDDNPSWIYRDG